MDSSSVDTQAHKLNVRSQFGALNKSLVTCWKKKNLLTTCSKNWQLIIFEEKNNNSKVIIYAWVKPLGNPLLPNSLRTDAAAPCALHLTGSFEMWMPPPHQDFAAGLACLDLSQPLRWCKSEWTRQGIEAVKRARVWAVLLPPILPLFDLSLHYHSLSIPSSPHSAYPQCWLTCTTIHWEAAGMWNQPFASCGGGQKALYGMSDFPVLRHQNPSSSSTRAHATWREKRVRCAQRCWEDGGLEAPPILLSPLPQPSQKKGRMDPGKLMHDGFLSPLSKLPQFFSLLGHMPQKWLAYVQEKPEVT